MLFEMSKMLQTVSRGPMTRMEWQKGLRKMCWWSDDTKKSIAFRNNYRLGVSTMV